VVLIYDRDEDVSNHSIPANKNNLLYGTMVRATSAGSPGCPAGGQNAFDDLQSLSTKPLPSRLVSGVPAFETVAAPQPPNLASVATKMLDHHTGPLCLPSSGSDANCTQEIGSGNVAESCKGKKPVGRSVEGIDFGP
jgi:hypothetical protein